MLVFIQEGGELNLNKIANYFKKLDYSPRAGIKFSPSFMTFKEPLEGSYWRKRLTIKNTGTTVAEVRVLPPNSLVSFF